MDNDQVPVDTKPIDLEPEIPPSSIPKPSEEPTPTPIEADTDLPSVAAETSLDNTIAAVNVDDVNIPAAPAPERVSLPPMDPVEVPPPLPEPLPAPVPKPEPENMVVDEAPPNVGPSQRSGRPSPVDPQNYAPLDRPLNVTDALSYLDAVKVQFQDQPDVYNQFLDIMKEFKNELIDTPGVIKRVSQLFNGHPALIQGFNTFLPVGYRIECSTDAHDANFITVTTPTGTTMQTTNNGGKDKISWSTTYNPGSLRLPESSATLSSGLGASTDASAFPAIPSPDPRAYGVDGQAFEPAVQYVQKIKTRCDAETYRQFLDILSQYHSKPNEVDEEDVSKQIARLFKDAPDLRSDFRIFMPERSQQLLDDPSAFVPPEGRTRTGTPSGDAKGKRKLDTVNSISSGANVPQKRKRKVVEKEREREVVPVRPLPIANNKVKKPKHAVGQDLTPSSYNKHHTAPSPPRRTAQLPPSQRLPAANDDTQFFDRVKRMLDNRDTYNEFLKIINLFTQDFIDTARLIKESRNFLGDSELMKQFKVILGWNEKKEKETFLAEQQSEFGWTRPTIAGFQNRPSRADLNIKYGSYRKLPKSEINVTCSGRDEMCRSVLNDEWVSHPTWSSEDSGFVAHKKNLYEEALHRSEEERHEYDFHIEAIVRTIAMLEPINNKIAQLSQEERVNFKLKPNLGGSGKSIHQRVVKKIYGRDAGLEVIQAMQDTPALAIPVVLQRLKQKEEEWKRAQREWNKVWREVDARNYIKSLDHQAIYFKAADKKAITTKTFVNQIEAAREEQMAKRASFIDPLFARTRPRHQLEFAVDDMQTLQDALKLTFSFLDRTQAQINFAERKRIEGFLRSFIPLFFLLDPVAFNSAFVVVQETVDSDISDDPASVEDADVSSTGSGGSRAGRNNRKGGNMSSGGDLRKKLLKSEQAKSTNRKTRAQEAASPSVSRLASPAPADEDPRADALAQGRRLSRRNIFFTNTVFYTLLRLFEMLYSRLNVFKGVAKSLTPESPSQSNSAASVLGLSAQADPTQSTQVIDRPTNAEHYYELLLESCERLFDNEIEQHAFEDQMRLMFGTKEAYKIFTVDKLIGAIIKQVQIIFADVKSQDLLEILKRERALPSPTTQDQINSRRNAEKVLGPDENLFRIDWLPESRTMAIQLIGKDDSSFDDSEVITGRWQSYIDSFVSSETTEGVSASRVKLPYLRRSLPPGTRDVQPDVATQDGLEMKICVRTYRLFFVSNSEDFLWKFPSKEEKRKATEHMKAREALRRIWLENAKKGS